MSRAQEERKASADTVVNPDTGEREVPATAPIATARPEMDETEAAKQAGLLMDMRETAQALGLAYMADGHVKGYEQYKYQAWQKKLLVEAWSPLIQEMGLRVNKFIRVLYAEGISTTPLAVTAAKARSYRLENERLRRQLQQMQAATAAAASRNQQEQAAPLAPPPPQAQSWNRMDYDSARKWEVDDNGFFKEDQNGFIKAADRREKPLLKPEVYQRLIKWNTKERIDRIFNV